MKRAAQLFTFDELLPASSYVERIWHTRSEPEPAFISVAASHWEIVVTARRGTIEVTIRGPETKATAVDIPQQAEFFGVELRLGVFMPSLPPSSLVDRMVSLPARRGSFALGGSTWPVPTPDTADSFVDRLARDGLLAFDPVAAAAVEGDVTGLSARSIERRVARATGLTRGTIRQLRRAERAVELLERGVPPLQTARDAGYSDQAHLTRSLRRFIGQTPSQVAGSARPSA